jgi:hypothetical protein
LVSYTAVSVSVTSSSHVLLGTTFCESYAESDYHLTRDHLESMT